MAFIAITVCLQKLLTILFFGQRHNDKTNDYQLKFSSQTELTEQSMKLHHILLTNIWLKAHTTTDGHATPGCGKRLGDKDSTSCNPGTIKTTETSDAVNDGHGRLSTNSSVEKKTWLKHSDSETHLSCA